MKARTIAAGGLVSIAALIGGNEVQFQNERTKAVAEHHQDKMVEYMKRHVGQEIRSLRTENSETFKDTSLTDNLPRFHSKIYAAQRYWKDADVDTLRPLDLTVHEVSMLAKLNPLRTHDKFVDVGPYRATWKDDKPNDINIESEGVSISYTAIYDAKNTVTKTDILATGIKETITLLDVNAAHTLQWIVETDGSLVARADNSFDVRAGDGSVPMRIDKPTAWDKAGKPVMAVASVAGDTLTFKVTVLPGQNYPITVDPTVRVVVPDTDATTGQVSNIAGNDDYNAARNATSGSTVDNTPTVGLYRNSGIPQVSIDRSLFRFDTSSIPASAIYDSARFKAVVAADVATTEFNFKVCATTDTLNAAYINGSMFNEIAGWAASGAYSPTYLSGTAMSTTGKSAGDTLSFLFNTAGHTAITEGGVTQFWVLSDADISSTPPADPTASEYTLEDDSPYLTVYYYYYLYNTPETTDFPLAAYYTHKPDADATYSTARLTVDPAYITSGAADTLGQWYDGANYRIYRQSFYAPVNRTMNRIYAASIVFTGAADSSTTDFTITAVQGNWTINTADDLRMIFANVDTTVRYGTKSTASFNAAGEDSIPFDATGKAAVLSVMGDSLFVTIFSNRDIAGTTPTGKEYVKMNPSGALLRVTWALDDSVPADVSVTSIASRTDSLLVTWRDRTLDETGFTIVDGYTGTVLTDTTAANVQTKRIGGLLPNTIHAYKVKVVGGTYDDSTSAADSSQTYAAVLGKPTVIAWAESLRKIILDTVGAKNPGKTRYAVQESTTTKWVDYLTGVNDSLAAGLDSSTAEYRTLGNWGDTIVVRFPVGMKSVFRIWSKSGGP